MIDSYVRCRLQSIQRSGLLNLSISRRYPSSCSRNYAARVRPSIAGKGKDRQVDWQSPLADVEVLADHGGRLVTGLARQFFNRRLAWTNGLGVCSQCP